jgi:predicted metal-dependent hydrolase
MARVPRTTATVTVMALAQGLEAGRAAFNRGAYFEAHELWEEAWRELAGGERIVLQGLIQIAAGLHHMQEQRPRPAAALLRKGLEKISQDVPAALAHLRIEALGGAMAVLLAGLSAEGTTPDVSSFRL